VSFLGKGIWGGGQVPLPKSAFGPEKRDWVGDEEVTKLFDRANKEVKRIVTLEEGLHTTCAANGATFRVDVIRDPRNSLCYLDMACEGCGAYKKVRINEKSGTSEIIAATVTGNMPKPMTAEESLKEIAKIEATRRQKQAEEEVARREQERKNVERSERVKRNLLDRPMFTAPPIPAPPIRQFFTSAAPWASAAPWVVWDSVDERPLDAKPLKGNLGAKAKHVDKLGLQRAAPANEDEV
jgi:hypothetical protein